MLHIQVFSGKRGTKTARALWQETDAKPGSWVALVVNKTAYFLLFLFFFCLSCYPFILFLEASFSSRLEAPI